MWFYLWFGVVAAWFLVSLAGVVLNAVTIAQIKEGRRTIAAHPDWKWSRIIYARQLRAARTRAIICSAFMVLAPINWIGATVPSDIGANDKLWVAAPFWLVIVVRSVLMFVAILVVGLTVLDMREGNGDA